MTLPMQSAVVGSQAGQPDVLHVQADTSAADSPRSWYALLVLTLSYSLANIDRQLINLLLDPIKRSLLISDTQLSLVQGTAFISAYLLAAPCFGRLVDIRHRRNILLLGIAAWCAFTVLCGYADSYAEIFLARFGVGASEACVLPVGWSMISDYFSARRAPRALSVFMLGPQLGGGFSLMAGSLVIGFASDIRSHVSALGQAETWQIAFITVGSAGSLLIALLLAVREPRRSQMFKADADERHFTIREAAAFLWERRAFYGRINIGVGMLGTVVIAMPAWLPAFLIRYHGLSAGMLGYRFGVLVLLFGTAGVLAGPWFAGLLSRRGCEDSALRVTTWSMVAFAGCAATFPLMPTAAGAMIFIAAAVFLYSVPTAILAAAIQVATPNRMRGFVASLYPFCAQLIGYGLGPTVVAMLTDKVFRDPRMVGYSLSVVCVGAALVAAWLFSGVSPAYRRMLEEERVRIAR